MARIPEEEVERLKREVSLERLVAGSGVELRPHGKDLVGRCPFHDDREPSLVVTPAKNLWHCLGACAAGGSVIDWVMRSEKVSFRRAVEILRDKAGLAPLPVARGTEAALPMDADDGELLKRVARFYHETLKQSPQALEYLEKRGIRSSEALESFQLGYANRTLAYRLPERNRLAGEAIRGKLQSLGILRESGHELMNGSLTIPIFDENGRVVQMYGRKVRDDLRKGTPSHLYLPGPLRGVWNIRALQGWSGARGPLPDADDLRNADHESRVTDHGREIILCEALIDALTFWVHGFRNVTAAYGVNGFTEDHWTAFRKHGVERVYIAYDRDEAGDKAAAELASKLMAEGMECFRVRFPKGMDANEYALRMSPPSKALGLLLRSAEWLGKGKKTSGVARSPASVVSKTRPGADEAASASLPEPVWTAPPPAAHSRPAGEAAPENAARDAGPFPETATPFLAASSEPFPEEAAEKETTVVPVSAPVSSDAATAASRFTHEPAPEPSEVAPASSPPAPEPAPGPVPSAALPAVSLFPPGPGLDIPAQVSGDEVVLPLGVCRWRVRGLFKNLSYDLLKVNVLVSRGEAFHIDTFDLYQARHRATFVKQASLELGLKEDVVKADLGRVLLKLEELQDAQIRKALEPKEKVVELTVEEKAEAMELLRDPNLLERILADFETCGVVGEETNKLVGYLAAVSRKLEKPLAVLIQSSSAAGKSALMEAVLAFVPDEEKVKYSAMTGQSLFYMGETDLRHKILAIAEEEGAERAAYALKMLQSEGELSIASTGKDPATGRLVTHEYKVSGPVMVFLTTTSIEIDEELQNRCIVLTVDENREQTRAIHRLQRELRTLEGYRLKTERARLLRLHRNAQRLLRRLPVINPYSRRLTFLDDKTRTRRDHDKYLDLIESIALLHQHQRPSKTLTEGGKPVRYLEVTPEDIEVANRLADEVLGRSLDELPPQTRRFLFLLETAVTARCAAAGLPRDEFRFSRRDARLFTGWSCPQVRKHLERLVEMEYVLTHRGGRGQSFVYELLYDGKGKGGEPFVMGLIDAVSLRGAGTTGSLTPFGTGLTPAPFELDPSLTRHSPPVAPRLTGGLFPSGEASIRNLERFVPKRSEKTHQGGNGKKPPSYRETGHGSVPSLAAEAAKETVAAAPAVRP